MKKILFLILIFCSCVPETSTTSRNTNESDEYVPDVVETSLDADYFAYQDLNFELDTKTVISSLDSLKTYNYSLDNSPSWARIDSTTGIITGVPDVHFVHRNLKVIATNNNDSSDSIESDVFSIGVYGDPLKEHQWHIENVGQSAFSSSRGVSGIDINSNFALQNFFNGSDVKIAVSDTGVEIKHSDLSSNIIAGASRNYTLASPYIGTPTADNAHGTAVSGIIAATGWNNLGGIGVAPMAQIAGFQFLSSAQTTNILIHQASGDFDIFNYSYGDTIFRDTISDEDYLDQIEHMYKNGRSRKGAFFVKSAGNEFRTADDFSNPTICASHNANFPFENESPYMLIVGAINAQGVKSSYSNAGSNLWVTAPGGEFGDSAPAIVTTDLPTCLKGYSIASSNPTNSFEYANPLNNNCDYTSAMNGTSSSAPIVSGTIALILSANPNLSNREVKHILAMTSKKVDQENLSHSGLNHVSSSLNACPTLRLTDHIYEQGWVTNSQGVAFNNYYGFGLVDAEAAIKMALDFNLDPLGALPLDEAIEENVDFSMDSFSRNGLNLDIPDNSAVGITDRLRVLSDVNFIETIQIKVQVTHTKSGQIGVELTSPSGTKSILMNINNSFLIGDDSNLNITLSSNAFYGENPDGNWQIKLVDGQDTESGTLTSWSMAIFGH